MSWILIIFLWLSSTNANGNSSNDSNSTYFHFIDASRTKDLLFQFEKRVQEQSGTKCGHWIVGDSTQHILKSFGMNDSDDSYTMYLSLCNDQFAHESMGNHLTNYFTYRACAAMSGAHFVSVYSQHENLRKSHHYLDPSIEETAPFYLSFPRVFVHPDPKPVKEYERLVKEKCVCVWNCLGVAGSPYLSFLPWIREVFQVALKAYLRTVDTINGTIITPHDYSNAPKDTFLPLIPNVTIHYRCGDNIEAHKARMLGHGILPFTKILPLIPKNSPYIYVLSESPGRSVAQCTFILQWLLEAIEEANPRSVVVLKRGDKHLIDQARMTFSSTLIASASSFGYFAVIAHDGDNVYLPTSELFPPASTSLGEHFHWIHPPGLIIGWPMPWYLIRFSLFEREITIKDCEGQLVQGRGRSVFVVIKGKKYSFSSADYFSKLGYDFGHVWHLGEAFVNAIPDGGAVEALSPAPSPLPIPPHLQCGRSHCSN